MNIPHVYKRAVDGFIIPPRTFFQMFVSAARGTFALFNEHNRSEFIEYLDNGTINEAVISQATAGPMIMLSLFHDLKNPLFKQNQFDPTEFLSGVGPALENFHNISGALENDLHNIKKNGKSSTKNAIKDDPSTAASAVGGEEKSKTENDDAGAVEEVMTALGMQPLGSMMITPDAGRGFSAILSHDWRDDAKKDPESLAGQLSRMVTEELFQIHQVSSKTQFLLQNHARNIQFKEGSCSVNNVALLSARAFLCRERETDKSNNNENGAEFSEGPRYETIDFDEEQDQEKDQAEGKKGAGVAAQMEVLYDVTQEFFVENLNTASSSKEEEGKEVSKPGPEKMQTTIVSVATLEGWLKDGPDGELRWRLALYRPAFEFPGIQQAY